MSDYSIYSTEADWLYHMDLALGLVTNMDNSIGLTACCFVRFYFYIVYGETMTSLNTCSMCAFYRPEHSSEGVCVQHEKKVLGRDRGCVNSADLYSLMSTGDKRKKVRVRK